MRSIRLKKSLKDWGRLAAKLGLLLTDSKVRAAIGDQFKDRAEGATDTVVSKYEDAVDRLEAAGTTLRGRRYWASRGGSFLLGMGVGAGLGILLAPAAGSKTREVIHDKAVDMKDKVIESASRATGKVRRTVSSMPPTGTEG